MESIRNSKRSFEEGGGQFLYCASSLGEKSKLTCFRTDDGKMTWEYEFSSPIHTQPCLSQGILIVALLRGEIYAFATNPVLQETTTPETTPETPPESIPPSESTFTSILVVGSLFSIGVFIAYYFIRKKH